MTGRSETAAGGGGGGGLRCALSLAKAALNGSDAVTGCAPALPDVPGCTAGKATDCAPEIVSMKVCVARASHSGPERRANGVSMPDCSTTHGAESRVAGNSTTPALSFGLIRLAVVRLSLMRRLKCTPSPLHSGLRNSSTGQNSIDMAAAKILGRACAIMA